MADARIRGRFETLERFGIAAERFADYVEHSSRMHGLDVVLLTIVLAGTGRHLLGDTEYAIPGPSFAVTRVGERHLLVTDGAALEVVNVYLDVDAHVIPPLAPPLDRALGALIPFNGATPTRLPQVQLDEVAAIRAMLELLVRETEAPGPGSTDAVPALRMLLLVECARALARHGFLRSSTPSSRTESAVDTVRDHLDRTFTEHHTLAELAGIAHLERTYLSRSFRARTGRTITRYLTDLRIDYARVLLRTTDQTIGNIAETSGFVDVSAFGRQFRRAAGVSPRAYRAGSRRSG